MKLNKLRLFGGRGKSAEPDFSRLPQHIAIIMDGNGRWASSRGLPRSMGHRAGSERLRSIIRLCNSIGIGYLTVYAFSTENWSRPAAEVEGIMGLLKEYLIRDVQEIIDENGRIRFIGDVTVLSDELQALIRDSEERSKNQTGMRLNICMNYGGRAEILRAARTLAQRAADGEIRPEDIDAALFASCLDTAGLPDPDLVIRPSGEQRISNFLLWESAYAEYYFTPVLWPDFDKEELYRAITAYQSRSRRYGGVEAKK